MTLRLSRQVRNRGEPGPFGGDGIRHSVIGHRLFVKGSVLERAGGAKRSLPCGGALTWQRIGQQPPAWELILGCGSRALAARCRPSESRAPNPEPRSHR